jgi:hypothetical protein
MDGAQLPLAGITRGRANIGAHILHFSAVPRPKCNKNVSIATSSAHWLRIADIKWNFIAFARAWTHVLC